MEAKTTQLKGVDVDIIQAVNAQLSFFACSNVFFDAGINKDIRRYIYCKTLKVPPFEGSYGQQPAQWVDRFFAIKSAFAKLEKKQYDDLKNKSKRKIK